MTRKSTPPQSGTARPDEIARFTAIADSWWDPEGEFKPLHHLNPARLAFIRTCAADHFGRDPDAPAPLDGLDVLDIGCGGGLLSEPVCRLGARVVGLDAAEKSIGVARLHAAQSDLDIAFHCTTPEAFASTTGKDFDLAMAMDVVEHVANLDNFLAIAAGFVRPGGAMIFSTVNRTLKSLALAKVGAEYILRWLPAGTHDWRMFVRPSQLADGLRPAGVEVTRLQGVSYHPLENAWRPGDDLSVNYLAFAVKV